MTEGRLLGIGAIVGVVTAAAISLRMVTGDYQGVEGLGIVLLAVCAPLGATLFGLILCIFRGTRRFGKALLAGGAAMIAVFIALMVFGSGM